MSQELMFFLLAGLQNEPVGGASKKGVEISKVRVEENEWSQRTEGKWLLKITKGSTNTEIF